MKYAVISDLHANESALRHVLDDAAAAGAERIVCLGDVVGYGPLPAETVALVRRSVGTTLAGNHDDAVSGRQSADDFIDLAGDAVKRHRAVLKTDDLAWLKSLPYVCQLEGAIAVHGDFTDPPHFNYIDDDDAAMRNFAATEAQLMFVGHTHVPGLFLTGQSGKVYRMNPQDFLLEEGKRYIVNPGAVGYPRESDGTCFSSYVLYDSTARTVAFRFLPFAVASLLQRGTMPHRWLRAAFAGGFAGLVAVLGFVAYFASQQPVSMPRGIVKEAMVSAIDLSLDRKTVTLRPGDRYVRANLKLDRKGDPVVLRVEFRSSSGDVLGELTETVKRSSAKRFKIPAGAISAHFTLSRQRASSRPVILSFNPMAR